MILYFSATGNSKYIAKAIADRLSDRAINMTPGIKKGEKGVYESETPYIFVFPVYLDMMPAFLRDFIAACEFKGNDRAYFVPTCAGAAGSVPNAAKELCERIGALRYMGAQKVIMPQNYIAHFKMSQPELQEKRLSECIKAVDEICDRIRKGEALPGSPSGGLMYGATKLVEKCYNRRFTMTKPFRATEKCIGCGACAKLCPVNAITLKNGVPTWVRRECVHCMACINLCPNQAIEYGKGTADKARYRCPEYGKQP